MDTSKAKYSGSKIVPYSDFRVGTAQEDLIMKSKIKTKRIGTWNVNTLLQADKIENLKIEIRRIKLDILGISEMRWRETGYFWSDEYRVIYSETEEGERTGQKGVGIILEKALGLRLLGYVQHSDRIIIIKINTKPNNTTKAEDNVIVMGDMNATVGEGKELAIVGQFGLGTRNDRGRILIEFCTRNDLIITNTHFQQHKRRKARKAPGDIRKAQIDYIMVKNRFKNQVKNSKSYPGADIGSDHNLVVAKCESKFKKLEKKNANVECGIIW
ncbi:Endonuclease/exonuclease/phosphatase [Cinara cedri]|uniref:Endonuclease/exonuclease/phosphatase n=1 Tax=Cinara cedri TaxID=506608 RepID=A0A5E4NJ52_9HEMI|nr:Endonuclease/exonuclease/phosphatase [Cinara cedri]